MEWWDKQDFNFQKHIFGKSRFRYPTMSFEAFFSEEDMRRIDLLWKI
jgi:hypothetical protein